MHWHKIYFLCLIWNLGFYFGYFTRLLSKYILVLFLTFTIGRSAPQVLPKLNQLTTLRSLFFSFKCHHIPFSSSAPGRVSEQTVTQMGALPQCTSAGQLGWSAEKQSSSSTAQQARQAAAVNSSLFFLKRISALCCFWVLFERSWRRMLLWHWHLAAVAGGAS